MPGKVNPVIPESLIQVCAQVMGNHHAVTLGGQWGFFELNTMMPLIAHNLLQSIRLLANSARNFSQRCIEGLKADQERCEEMIEKSLALVTALAPRIGYNEAARIARKAHENRKTIRQVLKKKNFLTKRAATSSDPRSMIAPMKMTKKRR
jgi:fumarate hydratase class II